MFFKISLIEKTFEHLSIIDKKSQSDRLKQGGGIQVSHYKVIYEIPCTIYRTIESQTNHDLARHHQSMIK